MMYLLRGYQTKTWGMVGEILYLALSPWCLSRLLILLPGELTCLLLRTMVTMLIDKYRYGGKLRTRGTTEEGTMP